MLEWPSAASSTIRAARVFACSAEISVCDNTRKTERVAWAISSCESRPCRSWSFWTARNTSPRFTSLPSTSAAEARVPAGRPMTRTWASVWPLVRARRRYSRASFLPRSQTTLLRCCALSLSSSLSLLLSPHLFLPSSLSPPLSPSSSFSPLLPCFLPFPLSFSVTRTGTTADGVLAVNAHPTAANHVFLHRGAAATSQQDVHPASLPTRRLHYSHVFCLC
mmetsp:Transcript_34329/g.55416  ORF Transcript_34329/g.55416 Transcript_34329/m.55416 type:complete len:221 (+) Transcript_34329:2152-2814(+)